MPSCQGCGTELGPAGKFCPECGTPRQPAACPSCGTPSTGGKFCAECGTPLTGAAPASSAGPPPAGPQPEPAVSRVAERRLTSILFGDLVGFTPLTESRDPEDVRELLSRYFERARTVIERYGGTVEKFIGDAVMAVWGVPVAREDDAERAVRAGLDLVEMVNGLGEEVGAAGLQLRVGITTGDVAVTVGAVAEGMVAGDAVNTAARVQSTAAPGTVWVDEMTRDLTAAAIAFEDTGAHELKGKAEPVRLFHATSIEGGIRGERQAQGLEPPFTGRERQLRLVKELLHTAVDERRPQLVLISGPAGVGKSRLAWEFEKYIDGVTDVFAWHRGRCLSYGGGSVFSAIAQMVRSRLGLEEGEPIAGAAERLTQLLPDAAERAWITPRLELLIGVDDGAGYTQGDLFSAWTRFFECAGAGNPVVLLIEDLQYADESLLDFLEYLLANAGHAVYVVGVARPELLDRRPTLLANRRLTPLYVEPLPDDLMGTLLDGIVSGLTGEIRATLLERAAGIPLYAVETVRALLDRGIVVGEPGGYHLAREDVDVSEIGAPASLHALVASRLDALPALERRLVALANVLGQSFTREALEGLEGSGGDLSDGIAGLVRRDVLTMQTDRFADDQGHLRFVQSVVRQVAYETLSRRDRRAAHVAAATFLEREDATGDLIPVVARHLLDAVAASGEGDQDVGELRGRAVELFRAAADRARATGAPDAALRHLSVAAENTDDEELGLVIEESIVQAASDAAQVETCLEHAVEILPVLDARDPERAALVAAAAGNALAAVDRLSEAIALMEPRLAAIGEGVASPGRLALLTELSRASFFSGIDSEYPELYLDAAERNGAPEALAGALMLVAMQWGRRGRRATSTVALRGAVDFARRADNPTLLVRTLLNSAALSVGDDLPYALSAAAEAVELSPRASVEYRVFAYGNHLQALMLAGHWDELRERLTEADGDAFDLLGPLLSSLPLWLAEASGEAFDQEPVVLAVTDVTKRAWGWQQHLALARRSGDRDAVAEIARHASATAREVYPAFDDDFAHLWPRAVEALIATGRLDEAAAEIDEVTNSANQPPALLRAHLLRLRGLLALARDEDGEVLLREAIDAFDLFGAVPDAARARHALGDWLVAQGRGDEAQPLLAEARATYEELGADAWLARLEEPAVPR